MSSWQDAAVHDYETTGMSYQQIADKYGRERDTIIKLMRRRGAERTLPVSRPLGRPKVEDLEPLSPIHKAVGVHLNYFRTVKHGWNYKELGNHLNLSWWKLKAMEQGAYDFTLNDLARISALIKTPLLKLLVTPNIYAN